ATFKEDSGHILHPNFGYDKLTEDDTHLDRLLSTVGAVRPSTAARLTREAYLLDYDIGSPENGPMWLNKVNPKEDFIEDGLRSSMTSFLYQYCGLFA
ncbi:hypothetical protein, partial [Klebsiella pneumoniae]|uniref:hypothetical protein n=1 Tax=Klebsiella pneumoniae TaxID=573 RepID=UPI0039684EAD